MQGFEPDGRHEVVVEDRPWASPGGVELLARIHRPAAAGPWHALVDVHGGAWTSYDRTIDDYPATGLAAAGLVVVAVDFRMGPAFRYPTAVADVVAAVRWTKAHAAELGARPDRVGLVGGSSGGHLAALAALMPHAPAFATTPIDVPTAVDARVAYVAALYPILDPLARYRYVLDRLREPQETRSPYFRPELLLAAHRDFFGDEATMARASALRIVEAGEADVLPPLWICHPELDENVPLEMTERFVAAYRRAGGPVELEVFADARHGFGNLSSAAADRCIARMRAFIGRQLAG